MDLELGGKIVVVTGGAKGIGEAVVRALVIEDAIPVIVDRDEAAGRRTIEQITAAGSRCELVVRDLAEPGECSAAMDEVVRVTGRVDALVNNAGLNDGVGIEDGTPEAFMTSLRRSLVHYFEMAHFALPFLKEARGAIVNVSSKVALTGQGGTSGYAAAKGGILALTREWAVDLSRYGVRVNAVIPAEVITPAYRQWLNNFPNSEEKLAGIVEKIPLGQRMTKPEEIAATVLFLLSPQAGHITGQHVVVDGGYVHLDRSMT
ncbi:MAG: SDR family oxidoreductase [Gemmatimonadota bacterium]|nr:MAG: SDR family oxidoreductase [Gemmatimonadota bacterium]